MVELVEERLCHAFVRLFQNLLEELLVFNKSVDMILGSVFTCGNLKNKCYTEQRLLGVPVCHHLRGKDERSREGTKQQKLENLAVTTADRVREVLLFPLKLLFLVER